MTYRIHGRGIDAHGDVCIAIVNEAGAPVLLITGQTSDDRSVEEAEALARVAAAGPEMLAFLRKLVRCWKHDDPEHFVHLGEVYNKAEALIDRIEGGENAEEAL